MQKKTEISKRILSAGLALMLLVALATTALAVEGGDVVSVSNGTELDEAIRTLTGAGSLTVNLIADIDAVSSATYTGYTSGAVLVINGNGHTINGNGTNKTGLRFGARGQALNLTVSDTTFKNMTNSDRHGGGALGLWNGDLNVSGCTFTNNSTTSGPGGAIRHQGGTVTNIENSTFTENSATSAGGALNIGVSGTLKNVTILNNTSPTVGGINGSASRELVLTGSTVYGNTATDMANVIDGGGNILEEPKSNLKIAHVPEMSAAMKQVFAVSAKINTDPVNLIEGRIYYNSELYNVNVYFSEQLSGATVAIINGDGAGHVNIVTGVKNEETIGFDGEVTIAYVEVTPKAGQTPDRAYVQLGDVKAYSRGETVAVTTNPDDALAMFTYRSKSDVNGDGSITAADLSLVLYYFGTNNADSDINEDGIVDMMDITVLVQALYA